MMPSGQCRKCRSPDFSQENEIKHTNCTESDKIESDKTEMYCSSLIYLQHLKC